jgi:hypothetical protein
VEADEESGAVEMSGGLLTMGRKEDAVDGWAETDGLDEPSPTIGASAVDESSVSAPLALNLGDVGEADATTADVLIGSFSLFDVEVEDEADDVTLIAGVVVSARIASVEAEELAGGLWAIDSGGPAMEGR